MKKCNQKWFNPQKVKKQIAIAVAISLVCAIPISTFAQVLKFSIKKSNTSIQSVLQELEKGSEYTFFYNDNQVKLNKKVSINVEDAPIEVVLNQIFENSGYSYRIVENQIVIYTIPTTTAQQTVQQQKQQKVTGVVKDIAGDPIIGASIIEKGSSSNGTITNVNGEFSLIVTGNELQVSYIGYIPQTINLKPGVSSYNVIMKEDTKTLDEVVVVGYSTQKKESLTGALQTVKSDKLKDITTPSVENMLNGKVPGVYVAPGSGQPGSGGAVVIRGQATLSGTTAPLWVIDGVIVGSNAGALNPSDIETMTILKDAASTAIYGSQGANGVILVTTKNGKAEKMTVNVSAKVGISKLGRGNMEMMDGAELYDYYKSFSNQEAITFSRYNDELRNCNFDWFDLAAQTGVTQDYNVSLSGGNEKIRSFLSIGVYDEEGAVKGYDYTRYNFRLKTTYNPFEWLSIKPALAGSRRDIEDKQYDVTSMFQRLPWDSPFDEEGNLVPNRYTGWVNSSNSNYLYDLQWNKSNSINYEFMGNLDFDIRITDWLSFSSVNNYKYIGYNYSEYTDPRSSSGEGVDGRMREYQTTTVRRYSNHIIRFNKMFGKHSINALAAYEFNDYWAKATDMYGIGFIPGFEVLDVVAKPEKVGGSISEWAVQSLLFNANYAFDNKYLAQLSFRRDGASNFGDNAKYGNFFSISAGWNINREKWFHASWVDVLKLRISYGSVGNRPSSLYPQYDLYSVSSKYNEESGALISQLGNKDLTWEKTYTTGTGVDVAFSDNRLRASFDWYNKYTSNILYAVPISGLVGVTSMWKNIGEMQNQGFELSIGGDIIRTKDWDWNIEINLGHNKNKLKKLYKTKNAEGQFVEKPIIISDGTSIAGTAKRVLQPGYPCDTYYLKEWAGVNPENGAPQWYKTVENEDGTLSRQKTSNYSEADQVKCGSSSPDIFGGFSTVLRWKDIDLNAVFGYSVGGQIYNYSRQEYDSDGAYNDRNQMKLQKGWNRWEKPGDIATHPVASYSNTSKSNSSSSRYLEKNDYLKLRSLSIGYNLKLPQYYINNMRIFFTGENLFCVTNYSGVDPEIPASDGSVIGTALPSVYPTVRKFMFGLNLTF